MKFKYYDPEILIPVLIEKGVSYSRVCSGCVFTDIPPEDCIHGENAMRSNSIQSDTFCAHCTDTIEESREPFRLHQDGTLEGRIKELEGIIEMAHNTDNV